MKTLLLTALLLASTPALADRIYVSNEKDNTITVLDGQSYNILATVPTGQRPRAILLSVDGKSLYICASDSDEIQVMDLATLKITGTLPSGPDPERFDTSPDGKFLYVANENDNKVSVVDVAAGKIVAETPVGIEPEGMAVSPDGKTVVDTTETTSMAHFIDTETHKVVANVLVDSRPRVAAWSPDGAQVWVSSEVGGAVNVIDATTHKILKKITFDVPGLTTGKAQPVDIKLTKDGATAFIALGPANRVAVVDAKTFAIQDYILVGQRVWNMGFSPDQKRLMTANGVSNDITIIDVATKKPVKSVPVGRSPWGVVVGP
ncbi:MAG TPA: PQQ-dependent catabolism-associated beta-propeller protein [Alphaproteobacteria bacterium]|jgi:PQQ-dependent catabolism-associated beta-propeller protein|nr:PQQ-dependent catabolism-associated beta-propeller protein [Alphaproteobacteria bacterium]